MKPIPSVEDALSWLRAGDLAPPPAASADPQLEARAERVAGCFQMFPDVLELILEMTLRKSPVDHRLEGEAYYRYAQAREGQNQIATALLFYLNEAERIRDGNPRSPGGSAGPTVAGPGGLTLRGASLPAGDGGPGDDWDGAGPGDPFSFV